MSNNIIVNESGTAANIENYKIVILGDQHVGKTSILSKYKYETVEEGLAVEMSEELGINIKQFNELGEFTKTYLREGRDVTVIQHIFEIISYDGEVVNNEPEKHRSIRWMSIDEIKNCKAVSDAVKNYLRIIENMKCSKCGFENPYSFKFCCQCGTFCYFVVK